MNSMQQWNKYVIDPSKYRGNKSTIGGLVIFWLLVTAMETIPETNHILKVKNTFGITDLLGVIIGYFFSIAIPYSVLNRRRKQIIKIEGDTLVIEGTRLLPASSVRIHKKDLKALTLEVRLDESNYTLNLVQKHGKRPERVILAGYVHTLDKGRIFDGISGFLHSNGFIFEEKNEMA